LHKRCYTQGFESDIAQGLLVAMAKSLLSGTLLNLSTSPLKGVGQSTCWQEWSLTRKTCPQASHDTHGSHSPPMESA
jgi:hypothetical protein